MTALAADPATLTEPTDVTDLTPATDPAEAPSEEVAVESLVDDISIDGMCGVY